MKNFIKNINLDSAFLVLLLLTVLVGSVGVLKHIVIPLALTLSLSYLGLCLVRGKAVIFPPNFKLFLFFILILFFHSLYFDGKIVYFWLFLTGSLYWLIGFNNQKLLEKIIIPFFIITGFIMAGISLVLRLRGITHLSPDNLFLPLEDWVRHNHLGDLWALILIPVIYKLILKISLKYLLVLFFGIGIIAESSSRSSVFALLSGLTFIITCLDENKSLSKHALIIKKWMNVILLLLGGILIYFSFTKSIFASRPYFYEAILGAITHPLGLGIGNFFQITTSTNIVHNLVLEIVLGLGLFSAIYIFWLYKIFNKLLSFPIKNPGIYALWLGFFVNFFFDTTYVIPGMFWLSFLVLALI